MRIHGPLEKGAAAEEEEGEEQGGDGGVLQGLEDREAVPSEADAGTGRDRPIGRELSCSRWYWVEARGSAPPSFESLACLAFFVGIFAWICLSLVETGRFMVLGLL